MLPANLTPIEVFDLAIHNFGIQEFAPHSAETYEVFRRSYTFDDGYLHPGEAPGIGVTVDKDSPVLAFSDR